MQPYITHKIYMNSEKNKLKKKVHANPESNINFFLVINTIKQNHVRSLTFTYLILLNFHCMDIARVMNFGCSTKQNHVTGFFYFSLYINHRKRRGFLCVILSSQS